MPNKKVASSYEQKILDKQVKKNYKRLSMVKRGLLSPSAEGLNSLNFNVVEKIDYEGYTFVSVELY